MDVQHLNTFCPQMISNLQPFIKLLTHTAESSHHKLISTLGPTPLSSEHPELSDLVLGGGQSTAFSCQMRGTARPPDIHQAPELVNDCQLGWGCSSAVEQLPSIRGSNPQHHKTEPNQTKSALKFTSFNFWN
jgi:hypothetical protein